VGARRSAAIAAACCGIVSGQSLRARARPAAMPNTLSDDPEDLLPTPSPSPLAMLNVSFAPRRILPRPQTILRAPARSASRRLRDTTARRPEKRNGSPRSRCTAANTPKRAQHVHRACRARRPHTTCGRMIEYVPLPARAQFPSGGLSLVPVEVSRPDGRGLAFPAPGIRIGLDVRARTPSFLGAASHGRNDG